MTQKLAPVVLFTYKRLSHTKLVIESLQKNVLAKKSILFVLSDLFKNDNDKEDVLAVRRYIRTIKGFRRIIIIENRKHRGCANSIISGVTRILQDFNKGIFLEDDLITSPHFLNFMNDGLSVYESNTKVASIVGYMYPIDFKKVDTFFMKGTDCWGWATWKRAWDNFDPDGISLYERLKKRKLLKQYDYENNLPTSLDLIAFNKGIQDSWDNRWHASIFLKDMYSLFPTKSLIKNIGFDNTGTHCDTSQYYHSDLYNDIIPIKRKNVKVDKFYYDKVIRFHRKVKWRLRFDKVRKLMRIMNTNI